MTDKRILDPCCGSRMFWFDQSNPDVLFGDIRRENHVLCDGRSLQVSPDVELDFRNLNLPDEHFNLVVFDPPHLTRVGDKSWTIKKYGSLSEHWRDDISKGFSECFRVLKPNGVLIFKWSEMQISTSEVLKLTHRKPLFGHKSGKRSNTHWLCFMKTEHLYSDLI